jgi:hypothetical protein
MNRFKRREKDKGGEGRGAPLPGIIIHGREDGRAATPRIHAFIWGGEAPPTPTLPFGRRKNVA